MACVSTTLSFSFTRCLRLTSSTTTRISHGSLQFAPLNNTKSLKLSSSSSISGVTSLLLPQQLFALLPQPHRLQSLTVVSVKGYKMKTHKALAKRFRVTGCRVLGGCLMSTNSCVLLGHGMFSNSSLAIRFKMTILNHDRFFSLNPSNKFI
ncbi:hypothetical protein K1719_041319 [Acacia pycnantha]|nr:hypothetical protein K1719_041319 [Acacia pycnantha]